MVDSRYSCSYHKSLVILLITFVPSLSAEEPTGGWKLDTGTRRFWGFSHCAVLTKDGYIISGQSSELMPRRGPRDLNSSETLLKQQFGSKESHYLVEGPDQVPCSLAISHDGKLLASGLWNSNPESQAGTLALRNVNSGESIWSHEAHKSLIHAVVFSPDDAVLVSVASDNTIKLWDTSTGKLLKTFQHETIPYDATFAPDEKQLVVVGKANFTQSWNLTTGAAKKIDFGHKHQILAIQFAPDGKTVATAGKDVILWDWEGNRTIRTFDIQKAQGDVATYSLAFSPDGKTLVTGHTNGGVSYWNLRTGELIRGTVHHADPKPYGSNVHSIGYHPEGKWLFSADEDGKIIKLDAATGEVLSVLGSPRN